MKYIFILVFCSLAALSYSAILTVDNNIPSIGQFATLQAAHDAATDGDVIQVYPSYTPYSGITVTKKLFIIGIGWIPVGQNGSVLWATQISSSMIFTLGSENSNLEGFSGNFSVTIDTENITLKKNMMGILTFTENGVNAFIVNNLISRDNQNLWIGCVIGMAVNSYGFFFNNLIINDSAGYYNQWSGSYYSSIFSYVNQNTSLINNFIYFPSSYYTTFCQSINGSPTIMNNLTVSFSIPETLTQLFNYNIDASTLSTIVDSTYRSLPGSPLINAGNPDASYNDLDNSRNDIGAFGGPTPFVDGGIPGLPAIYQISGDYVIGQDELWELQIKAKTNRD